MQVFVKTLTGKTYTIDIEPKNSVLDIKFKLVQKHGTDALSDNIIFAGKILSDNMTAKEYDIVHASMLHIVPPPMHRTDKDMQFFILKNITLLAGLNDPQSLLSTSLGKDVLHYIILLNFDIQDNKVKQSVPFVLNNWCKDKWLNNVNELLLTTQQAVDGCKDRTLELYPQAANSYTATLLREIRKNTYQDLSPDTVEDRCAIPSSIFIQMKRYIDANQYQMITSVKNVSEDFYKKIEAEFNTNHFTLFKAPASKPHREPMPLPSNAEQDNNTCVLF